MWTTDFVTATIFLTGVFSHSVQCFGPSMDLCLPQQTWCHGKLTYFVLLSFNLCHATFFRGIRHYLCIALQNTNKLCWHSFSYFFWQVCDWLYPIMAMNSPVLLCNTGVFMFPDMMAPAPGYYVGVVLSSELPAADRELFHDFMSQMTDLRVQVSECQQIWHNWTSFKLGHSLVFLTQWG